MMAQPDPGSALGMIEAEFLLELLMRLLADPARLDGTADVLDWGVCKQLRQMVFRSPLERCSPTSQASSPGISCAPEAPIRYGAGSAIRTRMAAKQAVRRPFVPRRQRTCRHFASSSMACAAGDFTSGICQTRGRPRPATGKVS